MKITLTCEHDPDTKVVYETKPPNLNELLQDITLFLRGCGFYLDGNLIVEENNSDPFPDIEYEPYMTEEQYEMFEIPQEESTGF
jgi:hypothetical protein